MRREELRLQVTTPSVDWQEPPGPAIVSEGVYRQRLAAVRRLSRSLGIDVLLVGQPENVLWLTGHEMAGTFYFTEVVVPTAQQDDLSLITHTADAALARMHAWVDDVRAWRHGQDHVGELIALLADRQLLGKNLRYGADIDGWYRISDLGLVQKLLDREIQDVTDGLERLRVVLHQEEVVHLLRAFSAAERGVFAALEATRPGVRESDIAAASARAYYRAGGENPSVWPQIAAGNRATLRHALASDAQVLPGEVVTVEIWGAHHRYSAVKARTAVAGRPSPVLLRRWRALQAALRAGQEALKPGETGGTVWQAMSEVLKFVDGRSPERLGLGVGLSFPLRVRWSLAIERDNPVELVDGMPVALVPALYGGADSTAVLGETFVVGESGGAPLSATDWELVGA